MYQANIMSIVNVVEKAQLAKNSGKKLNLIEEKGL